MKDLMTILHVLAAVLATWRLTDAIAADRIFEPVRRRAPRWYVLTCPRCLSVWVGLACTLAFAFIPWLNWPLALSWMYIWRMEIMQYRRQRSHATDAVAQALRMAEDARRRFGGQWPGQVPQPGQARPMEVTRADV